ncbi:MAG: hypothetical protein H0W87_07145 [Actinobacteria bacterium]|nr:hypothetical protein [Actinomycetota bacterium]
MKVLGVSLLASMIVAATASAAPQKNYFTFKTPGGVIECGVFVPGKYSESLLRCDIRTGLKPKVQRPKGCKFDFGSTLELRGTGRAFPGCISDAVGQVTKVVGYGQTFRKGPFTCKSARAGLTCKNTSKHGFFLSKKIWRRV